MKKITKDVILVAFPERAINYAWEDDSDKVNDIDIISQDDIEELRGSSDIILPAGTIPVGTTLIRHPYEKLKFVELEKAEDIFFKDKMNLMADILSYTGVKSVNVNAIIEKVETREWSATGDVRYKTVNIDSEIKRKTEERISQIYENIRTFDCSKKDYEIARKLAVDTGLINESDIKSYIDNPNCKSSSITTEVSNEYNSRLDVAINLNAMKGLLKTSAGFNNTVTKKMTVRIKITFTK